MIRILIVVVANVALSTANPLTALSIRQVPSCGGIVLPEHCYQAFNNSNIMSQNLTRDVNRLVDVVGTQLNTFCSGECLGPFLAISDCLGNVADRDTATQLVCTRQEDGTFCLVKVEQEVLHTNDSQLPSCVTPTSTTCSSSCRQSYIETRDRLGCCASSWYANSLSPFSSLERNFVICNVELTNPCTPASGAVTICLNFLLLATMILLSAAMI